MLRRSAFNRWLGRFSVATLILTATPAASALAHQTRAMRESVSSIAAAPAMWSRNSLQQDEARGLAPARIISSQIEIAGERARLQLELDGGRSLDISLRDGQVWVGNRSLGQARRGGTLDAAWRELLIKAMDTPTEVLAVLLVEWTPPAGESGTGTALHRELTAALGGAVNGRVESATGEEGASFDTVATLNQRIAELEERLDGKRAETTVITDRRRGRTTTTVGVGPTTIRVDRGNSSWYSPLRHIGRGFVGIISDLVVLAVLVGFGFATVYFARKPLEAVADTARTETLRAGLVGLAATFLVLPAYILGIVALAISIVGIPLLLAWVPLFWVALGVAAIFGYLAVGHAIGEGLAERRFYGGEWARRANSYYYVLTGLAALFALFLASHAVQMAGPWLGFIRGLLTFMAVVLTWISLTIGLGAVLLTRAGTRPRGKVAPSPADLEMGDLFEEESHV